MSLEHPVLYLLPRQEVKLEQLRGCLLLKYCDHAMAWILVPKRILDSDRRNGEDTVREEDQCTHIRQLGTVII